MRRRSGYSTPEQSAGPGSSDRWAVPYSGFVTLLFAFFVVMFAASRADLEKMKKAAASLQTAFSVAPPPSLPALPGGAERASGEGMLARTGDSHGNPVARRDPELESLREGIEEALNIELGSDEPSAKAQVTYDPRGLLIRLPVHAYFDPGERGVRPELRPVLERLGRVLAASERSILVEGHTDLGEARARTVNGWELSAARAAWVAQYWQDHFDLQASRIAVAGYSHYQPVTRERGQWEQSRNRRVEVVILGNNHGNP